VSSPLGAASGRCYDAYAGNNLGGGFVQSNAFVRIFIVPSVTAVIHRAP